MLREPGAAGAEVDAGAFGIERRGFRRNLLFPPPPSFGFGCSVVVEVVVLVGEAASSYSYSIISYSSSGPKVEVVGLTVVT